MKKNYTKSEIEIIYFNTLDVVTASGENEISLSGTFDENNEDNGSYVSIFG